MSDYKEPGNLSPYLQADIQRRLRAFRILEKAEEALGIITMAREEAAVDGWALPVSVEDYLFWVEEEALIQTHYKSYFADDPSGLTYAEVLQGLANELRLLDFRPSRPPWETESL